MPAKRLKIRRRGRQAIDPVTDHIYGIGVDSGVRERRHFDGWFGAANAEPEDGMPNILGPDDVGVVVAQQREGRGGIDNALIFQAGVVAGIVVANAAGTMALGAVGIQVGAGAFFEGGGGIHQGGKLRITCNDGFIDGGAEQTEPVQGADLVVGHAGGGIGEAPVELTRINAENIAGNMRVTPPSALKANASALLDGWSSHLPAMI